MTSAAEVAELARKSLLAADLSGFTDLFASDAVFEYPFGFLGAPPVLRGREEIRTHLVESRRPVRATIEPTEMASTVHETTNPEVVVVEWELAGTNLATGKPFRFASGVGVMTVHDGEITRYRDYTNPIGAATATGRLPELIAALTARAE
ncbi:MAG TPA: nuclear transport factor 2 family protein [Pseudonocardiaceae bacterium]|nr:nuclear transport factor 2 family protein [Pseudonocardiaceae bacterium]